MLDLAIHTVKTGADLHRIDSYPELSQSFQNNRITWFQSKKLNFVFWNRIPKQNLHLSFFVVNLGNIFFKMTDNVGSRRSGGVVQLAVTPY